MSQSHPAHRPGRATLRVCVIHVVGLDQKRFLGKGGCGRGVTKTQPGWAGKDQPGKWTGTAYSVTQRQDALGENRHLPWGLLGAPLLDLQDSEPKVSNVVSTLRRMLGANRGKTQALPDQTHCLHLAAPVHTTVTLMPRVQAWCLGLCGL